ncbi:PepSY domain-containing protein [Parvularcula flava]|uniref:PepSY domain-containing protein n=2 Tax=Aquisalinus luteolus TaxID=1566827 RepID=A0ABX0HKU3_9PROT|nr:PepSY-associated TM helix domain-containing protein [Aquisalinus luteolus]NHK28707.1 PepSY domain-containing protein [Aquisalinus luteolus]
MKRGGRSFRLRPLLVFWHRWFGLLSAVWLVLMAVTGSLIVFYDEGDALLNPDLRRVTPGAEWRPADEWVAAAREAFPDGYASIIDIPERADESVYMVVSDLPGAQNENLSDSAAVFVDPYTAQVLGYRWLDHAGFGRRYVMDILYRLHIDLYLGDWMMWFLGLVALLWMIDHIPAAILSFPVLKKWAASFTIRRGVKGHKRVFDLHRASGVWLLPVTFMLAVSGLYFNWYETVTHTVDAVSPVTERYIFHAPALDEPVYQPPVGFTAAIDSIDGEVDMIRLFPWSGLYEARVYDERDIDMYGRRMVVVDGVEGGIVSDRHVTENSAGGVFLAWQYPLHSGKAFGWPGRLLIFFSGIALTTICVTGVMIWWRKWRARNS